MKAYVVISMDTDEIEGTFYDYDGAFNYVKEYPSVQVIILEGEYHFWGVKNEYTNR